jgi:hypothetical protein
MPYFVVGFLFLFSSLISQAQTLTMPSQLDRSSPDTQECATCSADVPLSARQQLAESSVQSSPLPDAPSATVSLQPGTWSLSEAKQSAAPARPDPVWDKKMWAAHIILAGSMIFDVEMTHQGVAHHQCVEANTNVPRQPSRSELYLDNLKQFAPLVVMDWLGSAAERAGHLPRWVWKPMGYAGPIYGSVVHIRGGLSWYTRCW